MVLGGIFGLGWGTILRGLGLVVARRQLEHQIETIQQRAKKGFINTASYLERFKQSLFSFFSQTLDGKIPDNGWGRLW